MGAKDPSEIPRVERTALELFDDNVGANEESKSIAVYNNQLEDEREPALEKTQIAADIMI